MGRLQRLLPSLRRLGFQGRIVLGGPQITSAPRGVASLYPEADAFVRGHGEEALPAVLDAAHGARIPGVVWRGGPDTAESTFADLERAPSPWTTGVVPVARGGLVRMETQRGCKFRCTFCQHREAGEAHRPTRLGAGRVHAELDHFADAEVGEIAILDPIFNVDRRCLDVLGHLRRRGYRGVVNAQCRFETIDGAFLDACEGLDVVLEFGLRTIHPAEAAAVRRRNDRDRAERAIAALNDRDIPFLTSLIFGLPHQTLPSFRASVAWCLERRVPAVRAFPLIVLRGTPLAEERARWGIEVTPGPMSMVQRTATADEADIHAMAGIAEHLRRIEGRQPAHVEPRPPDLGRWRP